MALFMHCFRFTRRSARLAASGAGISSPVFFTVRSVLAAGVRYVATSDVQGLCRAATSHLNLRSENFLGCCGLGGMLRMLRSDSPRFAAAQQQGHLRQDLRFNEFKMPSVPCLPEPSTSLSNQVQLICSGFSEPDPLLRGLPACLCPRKGASRNSPGIASGRVVLGLASPLDVHGE